ncbi:MAG TPA: hypothetical protein VMZ52_14940 [Bryobacteraceae bacterium]|nr:hypothetical protein [Bryobacteraceae bacterium]
MLLAKPFVKKLTWAREIAANGRPIRNANQEPSDKGTKVCPAVLGATNWWPAAFDASSGLYYIQTIESCGIYKKGPVEWEVGRGSMGGSSRSAPTDPPERSSAPLISTPGKSMFDNKQFVALAWGPNILAFGLND